MNTKQNADLCENVFIGLGSNLGDSRQLLVKAWNLLGERPEVTLGELSAPYLSSPVGMNSSHWFTNAVGRVIARCTPLRLLEILQQVEASLGRLRNKELKGYQDRLIDLDLIYFGEVVCDEPRLTLPHPQRAERLFVLAPLAEIAPDFLDPELADGSTVARMHEDLRNRINARHVADQELLKSSWALEN
ncbi:MAG: 2-amino-4-hydroxy-6-hydroxymethyldihydropteridine diphosphokinase [Desulfofustis sp.]|nr:2-amino-4-hydroxy-6-hydroxymethyldihydropteridine diphosphokinase [Desulfofustis sp.]